MLHHADPAEGRKGKRPSRNVARPVRRPAGREDKTMGKAIIKIPLVTWRDGRPRYWPSAAQRKLGYHGEDLRHPGGDWFMVEECQAWSQKRQADIAERRQQIEDGTRPATVKRQVRAAHKSNLPTLGQVITAFREKDPRMLGREIVEGRKKRKPLSPNTVRFYKTCANAVEGLDDGRFWDELAGAITARNLAILLDRAEVEHGLAMTRGIRAMLSTAYKYGVRKQLVQANPVRHMEDNLPVLEPRVRYGSIEEMKALIAAADDLGRHDIGDAIALGLWTGQRQGDRLALTDGQINNDGILFRQSKKGGQPLLIPMAPELAGRLNAARTRRSVWRVNYPHVILDEKARRPFQSHWYRKVFREVRDHAARSCPSLADFRDQDLRDTAVTWLALAECDKHHIGSITGHSMKSIDEILKHYLGLHPDLARTAIGRLVSWYEGVEDQ